MMTRLVIIAEVMNPRYCASRGCRSPIGLHIRSAKEGYHSLPVPVPDGCLCMREAL